MMIDFTQIKETCLYVKDLKETLEFYHGILGCEVISEVPGRHVFFRVGTSVLLCFLATATRRETTLPPHWAEGKQHIAFEVKPADYQNVRKALMDQGVRITHDQPWKNDLESFYFEDPDGHVLEIVPKGIWE